MDQPWKWQALQQKSQLPGRRLSQGKPAWSGAVSPMERLLPLLQGGTNPAIADAGIAQCSTAHLIAITAHALVAAGACADCADLLLRLQQRRLDSGNPPDADMAIEVSLQVWRLLREQWRWRDLADNAAYYRAHPLMASRLAGMVRQD